MFIPKKTKYRKQQKGRSFKKINISPNIKSNRSGKVILRALDAGRVSSKHIVTCRQTINKIIKKYGKLNINIFADTPISNKPTEIRMGKGKGAVKYWVSRVKPGTTLFEINTAFNVLAIKAFKLIQNKLPIKTKII